MDLPASSPPRSPPPPVAPAASFGVDAEVVAIPASDEEAAGAAPAHGGGDNAALIDHGDGADASPPAADSDNSPLHVDNSSAAADGKRKRGRPKKVLPVAEVYGGEETPVAVAAPVVESGGKRKRGRPRKAPVPPPVSDVDDTDGDDDESLVLAAADTGGKRRPGRPRKIAGVAMVTKKKGKEEAVCFVCFDGGDLVICDKRGCTKVYHPACVNRDDAYFRTRGRWNCGWHICSICQKSAQYMCYTCTYSLCKACYRGSNFVCIRGNKGLCETCYGTVMLIESNEHSNGEQLGVEFSDQNSGGYLFKIYWSGLKGELSLTLDELSATKNHRKRLGAVAYKDDSSDESYNVNDDEEISSDNSGHHEVNGSSMKKVQRHFRNAVGEESLVKPIDNGETSMADDSKCTSKSSRSAVDEESSVKQVHNVEASTASETKWASRELLELVAHMKDGDTSQLSEYDVQALILAYINNYNLRDPRKKSQIICDPMLKRLFQKERVGHFEMLKLLESHFLMKEASQMIRDNNQGGGQALDSGEMDDEGYNDAAAKFTSDKRRKTRKRVEEREPQTNLDDFAAIDVHNIKLMYLRRSLMEDLLGDVENFSENVIGAFVRIRIPGTGQKKDMYRLVQVIGTHEATAKYKIGKKTTDIRLDVLNLNKTELVTMDTISNQEFTEEECRRLRQCIKCGFISRLTVGQVQEKARVLQALRVNDWLESEKLRLGHLRDRASEKGRRKELRECVEKLQLLNTAEERHRRLNDVPEIHADPKMDPAYESVDEGESDDKKQENISKSRKDRLDSIPSRNVNGEGKTSNTNWEVNRSAVLESALGEVDTHSRWGAQANTTAMEAGGWSNNQHAIISEQSHGASLETTLSPVSTVISAPSITSETEKMWQYKDPSQKVHGPFSMTQLRKWNTTGFFPPNLTIWRVSDSQYDCILLTDALNGKFRKDVQPLEPQHNSFPQPLKTAPMWVEKIQNQTNWNAPQTDTAFPASGDNQLGSAYRWPNQTNAWSAPVPSPMDDRIWPAPVPNPSNVSTWSSPVQAHNNFIPTAPLCGNNYRPPPHQGRGGRGGNDGRWNRGQDSGSSWNANRPAGQRPSGPGYERRQSNWNSSGQHSSGDVWNTQVANDSKNQWGNNMFNPPTPTPQPARGDCPASQRTPHHLLPEIKESNKEAASIAGGGWSSWSDSTPDKANKAEGWGSNSASAIPNHTDKADGCNSWSPVSSAVPDQASKTDGWGSNSTSTISNHTSSAVPGMASKADGWGSNSASTMLNHTDKANGGGSWSPVSPALSDKANVPEAVNTSPFPGRSDVLSGSDTTDSCIVEVSGTLNKNQFFQGDCPSPTPLCERPEVLAAQLDGRDPASAAPFMGTSNPHPHLCPEMDKGLQPALTVSDENVADEGNVTVAETGLAPELVKDNKLGSPVASTKPAVESDSAQRSVSNSEGWVPASDQKREHVVPGPSPWTSERWDLQQSQKQSDTEDVEWSLPSPTPSTNPSTGWDHLTPQNSRKVSSDTDTGWAEWGEPPSRAHASSNPRSGWGIAPGSTNINAGTTYMVPRSGDASTGLGAPSQGSTISASSWGAPVVGNAANPGWRAPEQGNPNQNPGWGSSNQNANWGAAPTSQGNGCWENNSGWGSHGNSGTHSVGGGRQLRTPPRVQGQTGICKFYEGGHCRKGSSCKYRHV